jgi:3-isopropylmalate/(R)-2-methylmalate dehydratase small subunit
MDRVAMLDRKILLVGDNFGTGSSREHAPWALTTWGIRAILSTSFADIFRSNSLKNGLLPIVLPAEQLQWLLVNPGVELTIDLEQGQISFPDGRLWPFQIEGFARYCLLNGVDELGFLLKQQPAIARYEAAHPALDA